LDFLSQHVGEVLSEPSMQLSLALLASVKKGLPHGLGASLVIYQAGALPQGRSVKGNKPVLLSCLKYRSCLLSGGLFNEALSVHNRIKEQKKLAYQRK
jgi:hypothetical protein